MVLKKLNTTVFLLVLTVNCVIAQDIKLEVADTKPLVCISDLPNAIPDFKHKLRTGLPNTLEIVLSVMDGNTSVKVYQIQQITYDLWDEVYKLQIIEGYSQPQIATVSEEALIRRLQNICIGNIVEKLQSQDNAGIHVQILFNRIEEERIRKIKEWMATSNGYSPKEGIDSSQIRPNVGGGESGLISNNITNILPPIIDNPNIVGSTQRDSNKAIPRFKKLFDKILDQFINEDTAADWKSDVLILHVDSNEIDATPNEN